MEGVATDGGKGGRKVNDDKGRAAFEGTVSDGG